MNSPFTGSEVLREVTYEALSFRGESFTVAYNFYKCVDTGQTFTDRILDELNLKQVYNAFREKHHIPFPEEIAEIRHQYGVSQRKMSAILGFGPNTYRNYENGDVPTLPNARLISLAAEPDEFKTLTRQCESLKDKERTKDLKKADEVKEKRSADQFLNIVFKYPYPSLYNGYRKPSLDRLAEMIAFFASQMKLYSTKLNKLLFYADFYHYKMHGASISGMSYQAIRMGPVPYRYGTLFEQGAENGLFMVKHIPFDEWENEGLLFKPNDAEMKLEFLGENEKETLQTVLEQLGGIKTDKLVEFSHQETGWKRNKDQQRFIEYAEAFLLKSL